MLSQPLTRKALLALCVGCLLLAGCTRSAQGAESAPLRFDKPTTTVINARQWDTTAQQWRNKDEQKDPLFFDTVHRFLLVRFPGCAETIHARLAEGYAVQKAQLVLTWTKQEFENVKGYHWRSWVYRNKPEPKWHAQAWLLAKPWADDPQTGPTWNAYINAAGYWRNGGALAAPFDRSSRPLGEAALNKDQPTGAIDVTAALQSEQFGTTIGERLRRLADCGLLVAKKELYNLQHGGGHLGQGGFGAARIWVRDPVLVVTLKKAERPAPLGDLPPAVDVKALAEKLKATGAGGFPTSQVPPNLEALIRKRQAERWKGLPEWMRQRAAELRTFPTQWRKDRYPLLYTELDKLEFADPERYLALMDHWLNVPPGLNLGHSHLDFVMMLNDCEEVLPEVLRYHLTKHIESRWLGPFTEMKALRYRVGYWGDMATLNHQSQYRAEAILVGERLGLQDVAMMGCRALSLLNRQMLYHDGTVQEHGDSFYYGISLSNWQGVATFSVDPLTRLKATMAVEKMLLDVNMTYHPGLRKQVSSVGRRYRIGELLTGQDVPRGALHTLSKKGTLVQPAKATQQGWNNLNFHAAAADRVALMAPWGRPWESNTIDQKPLPFEAVSSSYVRYTLKDPLYHKTFLGHNYAISSINVNYGRSWPIVAVWRHEAKDIEALEDRTLLFPWFYMNDAVANSHSIRDVTTKGVGCSPTRATLQHRNKLVFALRPTRRLFAEKFCAKGLKNIFSRIFVAGYKADARRLFINGKPVQSLPATAKQGDVITIHEGVSYVGLIPMPATDLGRKVEVKLHYHKPKQFKTTFLVLDSFALDTDEPLPNTDATWAKVDDTTLGWAIEMGDVSEYGSFEKFQAHMMAAKLDRRWDAEARTLNVTYASGADTLAFGFKTDFPRTNRGSAIEPKLVVTHMTVNGQDPYLPRGIDIDCPIAQLGKAARLTKAGAVLETAEGQPALLKVDTIGKTYEAVNPFIDPTPMRLTTPQGVVVTSEGPMGCGRVIVHPLAGLLDIDYQLPPPEGDRGTELLQAEAKAGKHGGHPDWEAPLSMYFRPGVDVTRARQDSARALIVTGLRQPPKVILNGKPLAGPFQALAVDGKIAYRIPIVRE